MKSQKALLLVAVVLVCIGVFKPNIPAWKFTPNVTPVVDTIVVDKPSDPIVLEKCQDVIMALKNNGDHKTDGKRLASLYLDLALLIELDGDNEVIKNTEEIRQANGLSGLMLSMDIKNKYPNLADAAKSVIVSSIGDDNVLLDPELRTKSAQAFRSLAWACNEGAK